MGGRAQSESQTQRGRERETAAWRGRTQEKEATGSDGITADTHSLLSGRASYLLNSARAEVFNNEGGDADGDVFLTHIIDSFCSSLQLFFKSPRKRSNMQERVQKHTRHIKGTHGLM